MFPIPASVFITQRNIVNIHKKGELFSGTIEWTIFPGCLRQWKFSLTGMHLN